MRVAEVGEVVEVYVGADTWARAEVRKAHEYAAMSGRRNGRGVAVHATLDDGSAVYASGNPWKGYSFRLLDG